MVGQALGPCCAIWFLPSLMLTSSSFLHREVQWHPCVESEFHVVQLCALWAFVHCEPQCIFISTFWGETCSKTLERFAPCCRLCQRLFPACLSSFSAVKPQLGRHPARGPGICPSGHRSLVSGESPAFQLILRISGGFNKTQGFCRLQSSRFRHTEGDCQTPCQESHSRPEERLV